jgi:YgiT-type zinc finger domain-containing protein
MRCVICRHGETRPGTVTVTLERGEATIVVKSVPAEVCAHCGEEYIDQETTAKVLAEADLAALSGVRVEVRSYQAA